METPKYVVIQDWVKGEINKGNYKDGDKMLSENELMKKFNFSRQTVRLAISNLENQGLLKKIKGSGTYVNISKVPNVDITKTIGIIISSLDNYIFPEIIKGIDNVLTTNGYMLNLSITYNKIKNETAILNSIMNKALDGLIIEGCKTAIPNPNKEIYAQLSQKIPCVFINNGYPEIDIPTVQMDNIEAGYMAAKALIDAGHTQIAGIFKSDDLQGHDRYKGFVNAMQEANLQINERGTIWFTSEDMDDFLDVNIEQLFARRYPDCTALICYNDEIAMRAISYLKKVNKKMPADVSLISFDNSFLSAFFGISSIHHKKSNLGSKAAEALIKLIKTGIREDILLKPELINRDSIKVRSFQNTWGSMNISDFDISE